MKRAFNFRIIPLVAWGIISLLPTPSSAANGKISGCVLDSTTNKPIFGAKVFLFVNERKDSLTSITDNYGNFTFKTVPPGIYKLRIAHEYYLDKLFQNISVRGKRTTFIKPIWLHLQPSGKGMVEVMGPAQIKLNDPTILWSDAIPLQAHSPNEPPKPVPSETLHIQLRSYSSDKTHDANDFKLKEDFIGAVKEYGIAISKDSSKANVFFRITPKHLGNGRLESVVFTQIDTRVKTRYQKLIPNSRKLNNTAFMQSLADTIFNPWKIPTVTGPKQKLKLPKGIALITGKILDKKTKEPIISARVRLLQNGQSARMGAISEEEGNFVIINVPKGIYDVEISYGPTYTKQLIKNVKVETGRIFETGIIYLEERHIEGDTIIFHTGNRNY